MARRQRDRKRSKPGDLFAMSVVAAILYVAYPPEQNLAKWIVVTPAVLLFWVSFLMPTYCDYQTLRTTPCTNPVDGKLRGCYRHRRLKRDAIFAGLGGRNPGQLFRVMWSAPDTRAKPIRPPANNQSTGENPANLYNFVMLVATLISTIAAVAALLQ